MAFPDLSHLWCQLNRSTSMCAYAKNVYYKQIAVTNVSTVYFNLEITFISVCLSF